MFTLSKTARFSLLILFFVVVPALFLGFYAISIVDAGGVVGEARREILLNAAIILLCIIAIIAGGLFSTALVRKEMELVHLKDDFVSRVSHELKTPLATIKLLAEMLEEGVADEQKRAEYYRSICRESERLDRLVHNILNFSRVTSGRLRFDPHPVVVQDMIQPLLDNLSLSLQGTGFCFAFENKTEVEQIVCSPDEISQALINLLENAVKYSDKPHCIKVVLEQLHHEYHLSVIDQGIGIAPQYHRRIFDQFYRVSSTATESKKGTGIGLAVVAAIARIHGGRVELHSEEGKGSIFTLVLPA